MTPRPLLVRLLRSLVLYTGFMFGRRPSAQVVFVGSLIAAIVMAITAVHEATLSHWLWTGLWGVLALWFAVDALRAWGWSKGSKTKD